MMRLFRALAYRRSVFGIWVGAFAMLLGGAVVRSETTASRQVDPGAAPQLPSIDERTCAQRLGQAIRFPTVSSTLQDPATEDAFASLLAHAEATYPLVHDSLEHETIGGFSKLYRWQGSDPDLAPVLLMGHADVVPVEPGTEDAWTQPPFAGVVDGEYVWGRGALDDKVAVFGVLEAAEHLLAEGFTPRRTVYFAFGHDEELGGGQGAKAIAQTLSERGIHLELVLDEGGVLVEPSIPGVDAPVALIGVAEKGYATFELSVSAEQGGHSSMPPDHTAVGILSRGITALEHEPMPSALRSPTADMLGTLAPEMSWGRRLVITNLWLFEPLVLQIMEGLPSANASIRTTSAATVIDGGTKDNVLPTRARALVNFRLAPGDTVEDARAHLMEVLDDDRIDVELQDGWRAPTPISSTDAEGYRVVAGTIRQMFPETLVAPYLTIAGTDGRHFEDVADNVYRFLPVRFEYEDRLRVHGRDERIAIRDYADAVRFYMALMKNV